MKSVITFTSTLSPQLMYWLTEYSQEINTTKKAVIEDALKLYQKKTKKQKMAEGFKKASKDMEIIKMADEGLADSLNQLTAIEK